MSSITLTPKTFTYSHFSGLGVGILRPGVIQSKFTKDTYVKPVHTANIIMEANLNCYDEDDRETGQPVPLRSNVYITPNQHWRVANVDEALSTVTLVYKHNILTMPVIYAEKYFENYPQTKEGKRLYRVGTTQSK